MSEITIKDINSKGDVIIGDGNIKISLNIIQNSSDDKLVELVSNMNKKVKNDNEMSKLEKSISENEGKDIEIEFIDDTPNLIKLIDICKNIILEVREYYNEKKILIVTILDFKFNFSF